MNTTAMIMAVGLIILSVVLFIAVRQELIHDNTLQKLANISGVVALFIAIATFTLPGMVKITPPPPPTPSVIRVLNDLPVYPSAKKLKPEEDMLAAEWDRQARESQKIFTDAGMSNTVTGTTFLLVGNPKCDDVAKYYATALQAAGYTEEKASVPSVRATQAGVGRFPGASFIRFVKGEASSGKRTMTIECILFPTLSKTYLAEWLWEF
jgi:hypothetical protein